jgi:ribonuclease P protein subunit RPR2
MKLNFLKILIISEDGNLRTLKLRDHLIRHILKNRVRNRPRDMGSIALERIEILFENAENRKKEGKDELADRYVELAKRISESSQVTIPENLKKKVCPGCGGYQGPEDVKIRKRGDKINHRCLKCGEVSRHEP